MNTAVEVMVEMVLTEKEVAMVAVEMVEAVLVMIMMELELKAVMEVGNMVVEALMVVAEVVEY